VSYAIVVAGLKVRLETISTLVSVLPYAPTAIHDAPMAYMLFDHAEYTHNSPVKVSRYFVTIRVAVRWQDNEMAEVQMMPYVDSVPAAILADPQLGGRIPSGMAMVTDAEGGFVTIAGVEYRVVDFTANVKVG